MTSCESERQVPPQELTRLTKDRHIDAYKALVPEIKFVANPTKP